MTSVEVALPSGAVLAIEVDESLRDEMEMAASSGERARRKATEVFEKGISSAAELAQLVQDRFQSSSLAYSEAKLHFGITFAAGVDAVVVQGEAQAAISLSVTWTSGGSS